MFILKRLNVAFIIDYGFIIKILTVHLITHRLIEILPQIAHKEIHYLHFVQSQETKNTSYAKICGNLIYLIVLRVIHFKPFRVIR